MSGLREAKRSARLQEQDLEDFKLESLAYFKEQLPSMIQQAFGVIYSPPKAQGKPGNH
jgi:hypothetical protein